MRAPQKPRTWGKRGAVFLLLAFFLPAAAFGQALPRADDRPSATRRTPVVAAVERVRAAVVNVAAEELVRIREPGRSTGDLFADLFERPRYRKGYQVISLGSGVIVSPDGYVLTNNHVIERGARFRVGLLDGRELLAKVVGADPSSDLAVLKLETKEKLPNVTTGRSADLLIGETLIAIGNPFGLANTVTTGVLSAVGRNIKAGGRTLFDFLQTDASINPGNSGGALLDIEGRLIGINTAILGDRNAGIGFAIPIDRARRIAEDLIAHGEVREGYLGLQVEDLPAKDGSQQVRSGGVKVAEVDPGSPADKAGLKRGDRIDTVQGVAPESAEEMRFRLRELPIGGSARLELSGTGGKHAVTLRAVELSGPEAAALAALRTGLYLSDERVEGESLVVVEKVARGSPADEAGIQPGDLVTEVNSREVSNLKEYQRAAARARRSGQLVLLVRRGYASERIAFTFDG